MEFKIDDTVFIRENYLHYCYMFCCDLSKNPINEEDLANRKMKITQVYTKSYVYTNEHPNLSFVNLVFSHNINRNIKLFDVPTNALCSIMEHRDNIISKILENE